MRLKYPLLRTAVCQVFLFALIAFYSQVCVGFEQTEVVYNVPPDTPPSTVGSGETVNHHSGLLLGDFETITFEAGSTYNRYSPEVSRGFMTALPGSTVNLYDGSTFEWRFEGDLNVFGGLHPVSSLVGGSTVLHSGVLGGYLDVASLDIRGGTASFSEAFASNVAISGGLLERFYLNEDSKIEVTGGTVSFGFVTDTSELVFRGGGIDPIVAHEPFVIDGNGLVTVHGNRFLVDDVPTPDLVLGEEYLVSQRGVQLKGYLEDGSFFQMHLSADDMTYRLVGAPIPEPASGTLICLAMSLAGKPRRRRRRT